MAEIAAHKRTDAKLQQAKEVAEAANLAKSRFVIGISHELRTPAERDPRLRAAAGTRSRDPGPPRRRAAHHPAQRRAPGRPDRRPARHLPHRGRAHRRSTATRSALREFLDQLVDMFRLQAGGQGHRLPLRPARRPAGASCTPTSSGCGRSCINLLSNAIKFTEARHVALRPALPQPDRRVRGSATPASASRQADLERIFEPFERGATPAARSTPGTGLGLTIAKLLTADHGRRDLGRERRRAAAAGSACG